MKKIILLSLAIISSMVASQTFACGEHQHPKKKTIITESTAKTSVKTNK